MEADLEVRIGCSERSIIRYQALESWGISMEGDDNGDAHELQIAHREHIRSFGGTSREYNLH